MELEATFPEMLDNIPHNTLRCEIRGSIFRVWAPFHLGEGWTIFLLYLFCHVQVLSTGFHQETLLMTGTACILNQQQHLKQAFHLMCRGCVLLLESAPALLKSVVSYLIPAVQASQPSCQLGSDVQIRLQDVSSLPPCPEVYFL